jgi:hypothetical protein
MLAPPLPRRRDVHDALAAACVTPQHAIHAGEQPGRRETRRRRRGECEREHIEPQRDHSVLPV